MRAVFFVTFALLAGCSSSFEKVQAMRAQAPDWYEARKTEFRGEGYPSLASVPESAPDYNPRRKLELSEADVRAALVLFNSDPRAEAAVETPEAIMAWAAEVRRAVEGRLPAPNFMTDAEVEEIKARFSVPRARL
nr:hypothetical protein [Hyphomonas sp. Mor2]